MRPMPFNPFCLLPPRHFPTPTPSYPHKLTLHPPTTPRAEGLEFFVTRKACLVSGTLRAMLTSSFSEAHDGVVNLSEIRASVLEKAIRYCHYKLRYQDGQGKVPAFPIEPDEALELLMASNYLDL